MFDQSHLDSTLASPVNDPFASLRSFVEDYREALLNAAALLAGQRGAHLVHAIGDDLARGTRLSRRTRTALQMLREILELEHVHDETRSEASYFAALDPADPIVAEICLLTDRFRDALSQVGLDRPPASHRVAA